MPDSVALVCDNRDDVNWGCRGTSWALSDLISSRAPIVSRLTRHDVTAPQSAPPRWFPSQARPADVARRAVFHRFTPMVLGGRHTAVDEQLGYYRDYRMADMDLARDLILSRRGSVPLFDRMCRTIEDADLVVINGEGSLILRDPPRRDMLAQFAVIALARHFGRRVAYVNAMVSDSPSSPRSADTAQVAARALEQCDVVTVRDERSLHTLGEIAPAVAAQMIPDALFTWSARCRDEGGPRPDDLAALAPHGDPHPDLVAVSEGTPYVAVSGSSQASLDKPRAIETFTGVVRGLQSLGLPVVLVETCSGDVYLDAVGRATDSPVVPVRFALSRGAAILGGASVFVSGRYHPSILAALAGTPLVSLRGNSHKIEALRELLDQGADPVLSEHPEGAELDLLLSLATDAIDHEPMSRPVLQAQSAALGERAGSVVDALGLTGE